MKATSPRSFQTVVLILAVVGLIALALGGYLTPFSRLALNPFVAAQTWLATRYSALKDFVTSPSDVARLRAENAELEAKVARLESQVIELQEQVAEVEVLSALVQFVRANPENDYLAANVVGRDVSPFLHYVYINRGSDDGLRRGMPVVTHQGLVGRIDAVTAGAARVQLITDPSSNINVRIKPSQAEALLSGGITGEISLDMIPQDASVQSGDLVLTSGLGGNYPSNILIGQVTGIRRRDYDLFQTASVQPVVDFTQLEIVMIITNFNPVDITPLVP
ncbi:MAG: rod shape-determining protein MreC [Chloroflexota bacterium]|nr:MAG: rod shape-determining protein MreC [Chloroflexota bacterium]